ncbi:hypothetical protein HK104_008804 [Borealophlyctis nickersoniae]|nr:hypothetical protein HK104_008804 [Borealophlyctis nickersoniae]
MPPSRDPQQALSLFSLPPELLSSLSSALPSSDLPAGQPVRSAEPVDVSTTAQTQQLAGSTCNLCGGLRFTSPEDMRLHFKSDWHRYNLKRKLRSQPPVSEDVFDELAEVSSIEASDSEDNTASSGPESDVDSEKPKQNGKRRGAPKQGSPFIVFRMAGEGNEEKGVLVYKQALFPKKQSERGDDVPFLLEKIKAHQSAPKAEAYWALLMLGAGHFAGAIFDCKTEKAVVHKTFHRYTTRRKQGGAQSSNDQAKGKAKSAGAGLRRYNEMALQQEIRELLVEWKSYLNKSDLIVVHAPGASRKSVYFDSSVLDASDERIRSFPFTTRRPTFSELNRCFKELSMVRLQDMKPDAVAVADTKGDSGETADASRSHNGNVAESSVVPADEVRVPEVPTPSETLLKLADLCKRGKLDLLQGHLTNDSSLDVNHRFPDDLGISLLHIASSNNHPDIVGFLLDAGADPTLRGIRKLARPYDVASTKEVRDEFRRFVARSPDKWNYKEANIPGPLTAEMEAKQKEKEKEKKEKEKEKKKKQKERQRAAGKGSKPATPPEEEPEQEAARRPGSKRVGLVKLSKTEQEAVGMTPERRALLDREKRALAAESRMRTMQNKCAACGKSLSGLTPFEKMTYKYCSIACVQNVANIE